MSTPASSSIARTNRLPSGTSKSPTPSTSSLGIPFSFRSETTSFARVEPRVRVAHLAPDDRSIEKSCANHYTPLQIALVEHHALCSSQCHFLTTELGTEEIMWPLLPSLPG